MLCFFNGFCFCTRWKRVNDDVTEFKKKKINKYCSCLENLSVIYFYSGLVTDVWNLSGRIRIISLTRRRVVRVRYVYKNKPHTNNVVLIVLMTITCGRKSSTKCHNYISFCIFEILIFACVAVMKSFYTCILIHGYEWLWNIT